MGIHKKVYIGHVETINPDASELISPVESKVVALKLIGFDHVKKIPQYKPLRKYKEYYKIMRVEERPLVSSLGSFVGDKQIDYALRKTGKEEVKKLKKSA